MTPSILKKRKRESITKPKPQRPAKKFKKQTHYSSSSSSASADEGLSDFAAIDPSASNSDIDLADLDIEAPTSGNPKDSNPQSPPERQRPSLPKSAPSSTSASDSEASSSSSFASLSDHSDHSDHSDQSHRKKSKRNDPAAFSNSITSILASKLPTSTRTDPVLARSSSAHAANTALRESALEKRARQQLRAEKKALMEKGRVKDVLLGTAVGGIDGGEDGEEEEGKAEKTREDEKRLKKTAQRGVVKLFNAVRMAQVRGEEARKEALGKGIVGAKRREERVGEMSKKGFLELVASGGGGKRSGKGTVEKMAGEGIEEA
ncbi:MAG: hypothetical protein Q9207_004681 [Kuettlingeria erythrocarpa]